MSNSEGVWTYQDCALVLIDYQKEMFETIRSETSADLAELNVRLLARTAQAFNAFTLAGFTKMIPNPHILFGSDYLGNAGSAGNVVRGLESYDGWTPQQLRAVYRDNALQLLPRLRD